MLEYFVHLDRNDPPDDLALAVAEVPDDVTRIRIEAGRLPSNWRDSAAPPELARVGDDFARPGEHCILIVPSALAPTEHHFLINPAHAEFSRIVMRETEPLHYDTRLFQKPRQH